MYDDKPGEVRRFWCGLAYGTLLGIVTWAVIALAVRWAVTR